MLCLGQFLSKVLICLCLLLCSKLSNFFLYLSTFSCTLLPCQLTHFSNCRTTVVLSSLKSVCRVSVWSCICSSGGEFLLSCFLDAFQEGSMSFSTRQCIDLLSPSSQGVALIHWPLGTNLLSPHRIKKAEGDSYVSHKPVLQVFQSVLYVVCSLAVACSEQSMIEIHHHIQLQ